MTPRPFVWILIFFSLGIVVNQYFLIPKMISFSLTGLFILLSIFALRTKIFDWIFLCSCLFLSLVYSQVFLAIPLDHINRISYYDRAQPIIVEGVVVSDVERRPFFKTKKTVFSLDVKRVKTEVGWKNKKGVILVNLFRDELINYGDRLLLEGKLHKPFNFSNESNFSYRDYLYRKGITFIFSVKKDGQVSILQRKEGNVWIDRSLQFKHQLTSIFQRYLPKEEAGIIRAFLLGDRYDIPKNVYDLFKLSGVAHIIAISGFNIGIVAYMILLILKILPIPRQIQYVLTIGLLSFYAFITGGQPPVVRATIMAIVFLTGFVIEREVKPLNTLSIAALILLFINPLNLFDVGFQLSFVSVLCIVIFYPRCMDLFYRFWPALKEDAPSEIKQIIIRYCLQSVALSFVAYLGVWPLVVYYFHLVTPIVIFANLVIVPMASVLIFLGLGFLLIGGVWPFAAAAFAKCISILLNLMVAGVFLFTQVPGAYFQWSGLCLWMVFLYYGAILIITIYININKI